MLFRSTGMTASSMRESPEVGVQLDEGHRRGRDRTRTRFDGGMSARELRIAGGLSDCVRF
jgi:hypothetical protein